MKTYPNFVLENLELKNALLKGITGPVCVNAEQFSAWTATRDIYTECVQKKHPQWSFGSLCVFPSLTLLEESADYALSDEGVSDAMLRIIPEGTMSHDEETRLYTAMNRTALSKIARSLVPLEGLISDPELAALKGALISMVKNHELGRSLFQISGFYDHGLGDAASFIVEADNARDAGLLAQEYVDQITDESTVIPGAVTSSAFVQTHVNSALDLLESIQQLDNPVLQPKDDLS